MLGRRYILEELMAIERNRNFKGGRRKTSGSVELDGRLRRLLLMARKNQQPASLTQEEIARSLGISTAWYRMIENGATPSASLEVICDICELLDIDQLALELLGYLDVVEGLQMRTLLRKDTSLALEANIRNLPGVTPDESDILIETLHRIRSLRRARQEEKPAAGLPPSSRPVLIR